jgi:hypothetical protein
VNHDVIFEVRSEGQPVEGATVHFAGYEKQTGEDGRVAFNIDMAGPFKARVEKLGYEDASTLLWVFPEGNEKIPIRAIRAHPEQVGTVLASYRMAGANWAALKVYYRPFPNGDVKPSLITGDPENMWAPVSNEVFQKALAWEISHLKDWGFNIYLYAHLCPDPSYVKDFPRGEDAMQNYYEQRKRRALILSEFAEQQGVDLFDPFGYPPFSHLEHHLMYKELLPEVREKFSGKLATLVPLMYDEDMFKVPEYDYEGFDYVAVPFFLPVLPISPPEFRSRINEYFESAKNIREYGVKLLVDWVSRGGPLDAFDNPEDGRMWLLNAVLDEAFQRDVEGIETLMLWFHSRLVNPDNDPRFSYWQSRRPLNLVASYFSRPWNKERGETLRLLQHVTLTTIHNQEFRDWASARVEKAFDAYRRGDFTFANSIAKEVLEEAQLSNDNPLGIMIDGNDGEWEGLNPIYFNPSQTFPWFNLIWLGKKEVNDMRNLKSVYAVNDSENLYLMLEFYEPSKPLVRFFNISIDTSGEWTHREGEEYNIMLPYPRTEIFTVKYEGDRWEIRDKLLGDVGVAYGNVVEVKVPLEYIGHPERINLLVWYPGIAQWGDMEVDIVDWGK